MLKNDIFDYQTNKQAQKYQDNLEAIKIYISKQYHKYTAELINSIDSLQLDIPAEYADLTDKEPTVAALKKWELQYKKREEQCDIYANFLDSLYSLLWRQCTVLMKEKIKSHPTYDTINKSQNGIELLKLIKTLSHSYNDTHVNRVDAIDTYKIKYYLMKKQQHQPLAAFYQQFQAHVQMCLEVGIQLYDPGLLETIKKANGHTLATEADKLEVHNRAVAMRFVQASGHTEYLTHLRNSFLEGQDVYPKSLADAMTIVSQRQMRKPTTLPSMAQQNTTTSVAFQMTTNQTTPNTTEPTNQINSTTSTSNNRSARDSGECSNLEDGSANCTHHPNSVFTIA